MQNMQYMETDLPDGYTLREYRRRYDLVAERSLRKQARREKLRMRAYRLRLAQRTER